MSFHLLPETFSLFGQSSPFLMALDRNELGEVIGLVYGGRGLGYAYLFVMKVAKKAPVLDHQIS